MMKPTLKFFGEHAILLEWERKISEEINDEVLGVENILLEKFSEEITETVPSYHSLAIFLKNDISSKSFSEILKTEISQNILKKEKSQERTVVIPVCYDAQFALDIEAVAKKNKLSVEEVVQIHTSKTYRVYFLGFLPGFPYLGGMDERLATPRKNSPRENVAKGSVGIGGNQTGIYTVNSPGGWNIIGKSALSFFNVKRSPITLLNAGDLVQLKSVSIHEFKKIEVEVATDIYKLETQ